MKRKIRKKGKSPRGKVVGTKTSQTKKLKNHLKPMTEALQLPIQTVKEFADETKENSKGKLSFSFSTVLYFNIIYI